MSTWKVQQAGGPFAAQGCDPDGNYGHGAEPSEDGKLVFLSYWDSGFIRLDLTDPANPVYTGRAAFPANADGDAHSSQYDEARKLLFSADEDFCKASGSGIEKGFGYMRVWDFGDPAQRAADRLVQDAHARWGRTTRPQATSSSTTTSWSATTLYESWYTDGVRVVDVSDPRIPREVAYFVPPATENPGQAVPARRAHEHHAGLGCRRRRGNRSHLRERHELRPLDPAPDRIGGSEPDRDSASLRFCDACAQRVTDPRPRA